MTSNAICFCGDDLLIPIIFGVATLYDKGFNIYLLIWVKQSDVS